MDTPPRRQYTYSLQKPDAIYKLLADGRESFIETCSKDVPSGTNTASVSLYPRTGARLCMPM